MTKIHVFMVALVLGVAGLVSRPAAAEVPSAPAAREDGCLLGGVHVTSVEPHWRDLRFGKVSFRRLGGARLHVEATPGMTAEWIRLRLAQRASPPSASTPCALDVQGVDWSASSDGAGFAVTIGTSDPHRAAEVLRRATQLLR